MEAIAADISMTFIPICGPGFHDLTGYIGSFIGDNRTETITFFNTDPHPLQRPRPARGRSSARNSGSQRSTRSITPSLHRCRAANRASPISRGSRNRREGARITEIPIAKTQELAIHPFIEEDGPARGNIGDQWEGITHNRNNYEQPELESLAAHNRRQGHPRLFLAQAVHQLNGSLTL
jgi:hypothetical protein